MMMHVSWLLAVLVAATPSFPESAGVGPHGYDWLVGTWSCKNHLPTSIGGPSGQTIVFAPSGFDGLSVRVRGSGFERSGYIAYDAKSKTWWKPVAYPNGDSYTESTTQTGVKTEWKGTYFDASAKQTMNVRDVFTIVSPAKYLDVGQYQAAGLWHTGYNGVCTKV